MSLTQRREGREEEEGIGSSQGLGFRGQGSGGIVDFRLQIWDSGAAIHGQESRATRGDGGSLGHSGLAIVDFRLQIWGSGVGIRGQDARGTKERERMEAIRGFVR